MGHINASEEESESGVDQPGSESETASVSSKIERLILSLPPERRRKSFCKVIDRLLTSHEDSPIAVYPKELQSRIVDYMSPMVIVKINGVNLEMKVDSGAMRTIICCNTANRLQLTNAIKQLKNPVKLYGVGGNLLKVIGTVTVEVILHNRAATHDFFVIESKERYLTSLFGIDLAKKLPLILDLYTKKVYFRKKLNEDEEKAVKKTPEVTVKTEKPNWSDKENGEHDVQRKKSETLPKKQSSNEVPRRKKKWIPPSQPWLKLPKGPERTALKHEIRKERAQEVGTAEYRRKMERLAHYGPSRSTMVNVP